MGPDDADCLDIRVPEEIKNIKKWLSDKELGELKGEN